MKALIDFTPGGAQLLDAGTVVDHLVETRALTHEQLVRDGLAVLDRSSRCRTFVVRTGDAGFVLKQGTNSETVHSVGNESRVFSWLSGAGAGVPVPRMVSFDDGCLVTECVPGSTLAEVIAARPEARAERAPDVADVLAAVHSADVVDGGIEPARPSPAFLLADPPLIAFQYHSHGSHQLTRLIQADPALTTGLRLLYSEWQQTHLIHNDVRPENLIETPGADLVLIDWELAGLGDPRWDVAAVVADLLIAFLEDAGTWTLPADRRATTSAEKLDGLRRTVGTVLGRYQAGTGTDLHPADLARWVAGQIVLRTMERATTVSAVPAGCRHLLQVAANLFQRPDAGAQIFLGARRAA